MGSPESPRGSSGLLLLPWGRRHRGAAGNTNPADLLLNTGHRLGDSSALGADVSTAAHGVNFRDVLSSMCAELLEKAFYVPFPGRLGSFFLQLLRRCGFFVSGCGAVNLKSNI